ncbi:hypothetical protein J6590_108634 [Homalodisca vitripennis]|nr:hypothetical protein J6590_108634 [Homalodisca vitripennis]
MTFWSHSRFQGVHPTTIFMVFDICHKPKHEFAQWLQDKKLIASQYECPTCKKLMTLTEETSVREELIWKCQGWDGVKHTTKRSIRRGTWFENSSFSIQDVLLLSYYWYREYPHRTVQYEMQTSSARIILDWYNFCKGTCVDILLSRNSSVGGHGIKIELYESKFWKRSHGDNHKVVSQWVFCGLERDSTNCFLANVMDKTPKTILNVLKRHVLPGTVIYSDIWKDTKIEQEVYSHLTVHHELTFRDMENGGVGNTAEGIWTMIKRQFPAAKRSKALFDGFIGEFMYRRILNEAQDGYLQFLSDIVKVYTPSTSG